MNGVATLFDGWIGDELTDALFRGVEAHAGSAGLRVNVHLAIGAAGDGNVAGSVVELEANGSFDAEGAIEAAGGRGSHGASGAGQSGDQQREWSRYRKIETHSSSARVRGPVRLSTKRYADGGDYVPKGGPAQERCDLR